MAETISARSCAVRSLQQAVRGRAVLAFLDIQPLSPEHTLVIPKERWPPSTSCRTSLCRDGRCCRVARGARSDRRDRVQHPANKGRRAQAVFHVHFHISQLPDGAASAWAGSRASSIPTRARSSRRIGSTCSRPRREMVCSPRARNGASVLETVRARIAPRPPRSQVNPSVRNMKLSTRYLSIVTVCLGLSPRLPPCSTPARQARPRSAWPPSRRRAARPSESCARGTCR